MPVVHTTVTKADFLTTEVVLQRLVVKKELQGAFWKLFSVIWVKPCQQKPWLNRFPAFSKAENRVCKLGCNLW